MAGSISQPTQNSVFLDAFDPRQSADAGSFCQQCQHFQDFIFLSMFAVKNRTFGLSEGSSAGFALVTLYAAWRLADLFKVRYDLIILQLSVIRTG